MAETKIEKKVESELLKPATEMSNDEVRSVPRRLVKVQRTVSKSSKQEFYTATIQLYSGKRTIEEIRNATPEEKKLAESCGLISIGIKVKLTDQQFQMICLDKDLSLAEDVHVINAPVRLTKGLGENGKLYFMFENWLPGGIFLKSFIPDETMNFVSMTERKDPRFSKPEFKLIFSERKFSAADESGNAEVEY